MKKTFTRFLAALMLLAIFTPSFKAMGQTTVASFSRSGTSNSTTGGDFSTTFSAKSGYYQDNTGDCYMQILNTSAYWTTTPTSISFAAKIGGGSANRDLTNAVYVSLLDQNGDVIASTQTSVTAHITTAAGDDYTISIPVTNNVYGVKLSHEKESGYNVRYYSFSLSYVAGGVTPTTYTVTFDAGDGTFVGNSDFPSTSNTVAAGTYTLPSATPATGYTFSKWNIGAATYDAGASYTVSGNADFVASYTQDTPPTPVGDLLIDFESAESAYTDWTFANMTSQQTGSITAHGGTYYGTTGGKATASITTNSKIATPYTLTCYVSKQSTNTTASTWYIQVSSDGSDWTDVESRSATDMNKGEWKEFTADLTNYTNVYVRVYYSGSTAVRNIDDLTLLTSAPSVIAPTFSPAEGLYTSAQNVTISTTTSGATIYYTLDGTDPTTNSSVYSSPINVSSTTTIKAMAVASGNESSIVSATYTIVGHAGTMADPYTVADAHTAIDANAGITGVYATGIVSAIPTAWSSQYSNITFNFVDNSGDTDFLQAYRCVSGTGVDASEVAVGDVVVVYGNLTKYGSTYEFGQGCQLISLTHPAITVETPTFNPVAGIYTTTQNVTISCETSGATIYYTIDGTEPSSTSSEYTTAIPVSTTTTIKAIAILGENSSTVASATYAFLEHAGTEADPYTVADAYAAIDANVGITNVYATGIVSEIVTAFSSQYGNISYNISSDGTTTSNQLQAYRGKSYNGNNFTSEDDIQVGDIVVVYGTLQNYNGTYEFVAANQLVSLIRSTTFTLDIDQYTSGQNNGWYLIASPVSVDIESNTMISGTYDLYRFNPTATGAEWENYKNTEHSDFTTLEVGRGYLYANGNNGGIQLSFTGTPADNGEVTTAYNGWNLIGNPLSTAAIVDKDYYRMNDTRTGIMTTSSSDNVAKMEGIFVQAEEGETVTFTAASKGERSNSTESVVLNIMQDGKVIDRAIVRFNSDRQMLKFQLFQGSTKIYFPMEDADYAIVNSNGQGNMPVNFKAARTGEYTLSVETEGIDMNYMHIIDRLTGEDINVLLDNEYSFIASQSDVADRFILSFNENGYNAEANESFAFQNGSDIIVNGNGTLQVFDVTGRMVMNTTVNGVQTVNMPNGVYVFRMIGETVNTQKIVVR